MSVLRGAYLAFAIWGAVHVFFLSGVWLGPDSGVPIVRLFNWFEDPLTTPMGWEIVIASTVLTIWCMAEVYVRKNWIALLALPATWGIGLACGLPFYLFLRTAIAR